MRKTFVILYLGRLGLWHVRPMSSEVELWADDGTPCWFLACDIGPYSDIEKLVIGDFD